MIFAMLTTWILNVTHVIPAETNLLDKELLDERVKPGWYSVIAAMAAVGVVAALALVPAIAAAGIAFLSKNPVMGFGGLFLLRINVAFIIVSGVLTVIILRPEERD